MTGPLPSSPGVVKLTGPCLRRILEDMGVGPGWIPSARIYGWYVSMCEEDDLVPVSTKQFGMSLRELGHTSSTRRVDGRLARGWFIKMKAFRA